MVASTWSPNASVVAQANAAGLFKQELQLATLGQRTFNITTFAYVLGTGSTMVFKNGEILYRNLDYIEATTTSILLTEAAALGDEILLCGFVGITGSTIVDSILRADLLAASGSNIVGFTAPGAGAVYRSLQDKGREVISAKDYGLLGDGVTNNSAAFAVMIGALTALYTTFEVVFPPGSYLIGTNLTVPSNVVLTFSAGAKLVIPNGITLTFNYTELSSKRQQYFNCTGTGKVNGTLRNELIFPEWWGAIADGLHAPVGIDFSARAAAAARNAPALQAALTFAGNQYAVNGNTSTVSLTNGYYVYDTTLSIPLSVNLIGYGIGSALFYYSAAGNALEAIGTNNHLISDIFLAPIAGPTWNYTTGYGLYMNGVSTPIVRNVWSSGFGGGTFFFQSVIEGRLIGLISDNSAGPAFTIRGVGQGTVLYNCVTAGNAAACFDISGYDWHLIGCTAKDGATGTNGYYLNVCENINLTACGCHSINREGFLLTASVLNCTLTSCFVNDASEISAGTYAAMNISGTRNKLITPKITGNAPKYSYGIILGGGATDCSVVEDNITVGTIGYILDAQPIGNNTYKIRKVTTVDATPVNIWSKAFNNNAGAMLEARIVARQRDVAGATAMYTFVAYVRTNSANTAILSGPTSINTYESDALLDATFVLTSAAANAGVVSLQITGLAAGLSVDWEGEVKVISVTG